jgi:hypothetical protein
MGSGDLSTDLGLGSLAPASAVGAAQDHSQPAANPDAQPRARRRPPRREEDEDEFDGLSSAPVADERPAHQLDDIA